MYTQTELENLITYHQNKYYASEPEISDYEFDKLWDELSARFPNSELLSRVGTTSYDENDERKKVKHEIPMGSQEKINTYDGIKDWLRLKSISFPIVVEEKLDGISVELIYKCGKFVQAVTRGDGIIGTSIFENIRKVPSVPKQVSVTNDFSVRGEILLPFKNVEKLVGFEDNKTLNVRNVASGIANQKHTSYNLELITVVCYDTSINCSSEIEKINFLKQNGFMVPRIFVANNYQEIINNIERIKIARDNKDIPYQIDGSVLKQNVEPVNSNKEKARPDWQRAFKYQVDEFETTLTGVEFSRNGFNFTPVAILEPVDMYDTIVSRASLANVKEMKRLGIKIPCKVSVSKMNEIIPKVISVTGYFDDSKEVQIIDTCPICNEPLSVSDTYIKCTNPLCVTNSEHRIRKWIDTIGALGFGDVMITFLVYNMHFEHVAELYCNENVAAAISKYSSPKNVQKAFADLWARSRNIPLYDFVAGFDLEGLGSRIIKLISDSGFDTLETLRKVNYSDLVNIEGFGELRANLFLEQIVMLSEEMDAVLNTGRVTICEQPKKKTDAEHQKELVICITGSLSKPRKEYESLISNRGWKLSSSVTKNTDFLVNNDSNSTSSKNLAAKKNGTKIITESELVEMLRI